MRKIVAILSGKGGVGKTTLALNLGLALYELDEEVLVVDGDIKNPNVGLQLGLYEFPTTFHGVLADDINILEALHIHSSGLRIIPGSLALGYLDLNPSRIRHCFKDLDGWILLDSAPGLDMDVTSIVKACDNVIVVTNPEIPAVTDAMKLIKVAREFDKEIIGIVINKMGGPFELNKSEIEAVCGASILGSIPEDKNIKKSIGLKTPVIQYSPLSPASIEFKKIAANLAEKEYTPPSFLRLRRFFNR